ncbi:hypothetical protein DsansV1_C05g0053901 [Dioscorea sansibarensis]
MEIRLGGKSKEGAPFKRVFTSMPQPGNLVTNGSVDFYGCTADKSTTGGWKASTFVIGLYLYVRSSLFFIVFSMCLIFI